MGLQINKDTVYQDGAFKKIGKKAVSEKPAEVKKPEQGKTEAKKPANKPAKKASAATKPAKVNNSRAEGEKPAETQNKKIEENGTEK